MERVFTKDMGKNFSAGDRKDYPRHVWEHIAQNAGEPLDQFTRAADDARPSEKARGSSVGRRR